MLLPICYANAASVPAEVDQKMKNNINSITDEMRKQLNFYNLKDESEVPLSLGQPYEIYNLNPKKIKTLHDEYKSNGIDSIIINDSYWEYPLLDKNGKVVSSANVVKYNGNWEVVGIGQYLPRDLINFSSNEDEIKKYLNEQGILNILSIKHLRALPYHTDFIYVAAEGNDYLVPLFGNYSMLDVENKKLYPAGEILSKITELTNKQPSTNSKGEQLYGGTSGTNSSSNKTVTLLGIASFVAVCILFGLALKRIKRIKTNNGNI
jgi:hypothetical protein